MGRRTIQINLRLTPELRERIQSAADAHSLSMTGEITRRLEASFAWPADSVPPTASDTALRMGIVVAEVLEASGREAARHEKLPDPSRWIDDPYSFDQAVKAAALVLHDMGPPGLADYSEGSADSHDARTLREHLFTFLKGRLMMELNQGRPRDSSEEASGRTQWLRQTIGDFYFQRYDAKAGGNLLPANTRLSTGSDQ
jgi:hypothetical protein